MSRRGKLTDEERVAAVQEYQDGKGSFKAIGDKYGVTAYTVRSLVNRANAGGMDFVNEANGCFSICTFASPALSCSREAALH